MVMMLHDYWEGEAPPSHEFPVGWEGEAPPSHDFLNCLFVWLGGSLALPSSMKANTIRRQR